MLLIRFIIVIYFTRFIMLTKKILPALRSARNWSIDRSMKYYLTGDRDTMRLYDLLYQKIVDTIDLAVRIRRIENLEHE